MPQSYDSRTPREPYGGRGAYDSRRSDDGRDARNVRNARDARDVRETRAQTAAHGARTAHDDRYGAASPDRASDRTQRRITVSERDFSSEHNENAARQQELAEQRMQRHDFDAQGRRRPNVRRDDVRRASGERPSSGRRESGDGEGGRSRDGRSDRSGAQRSRNQRSRNQRSGDSHAVGRTKSELPGLPRRQSRRPSPNQVMLGPTGTQLSGGRGGNGLPLPFSLPLPVLIIAAVLAILVIVFIARSCGGAADEEKTGAAVGEAATASAADASTDAAGASAADTSPDAAEGAGAEGAAAEGAAGASTAASSSASESVTPAPVLANNGTNRVSFVAVGDNLPDDLIGYWADAQAGEEGDGTYDYTGLYRFIRPYVATADLAYMKQETHVGGDVIGPRGYPSFNTTDEMADAVVDTGFDLVASASNHAYDWGLYDALQHSVSLWETKPVVFTGTSVTEEQYNRIARVECNGITFALLDYTYGVNWPDNMELPEHSINFIDEDRIKADVARAKQQADVVLVAMHWGTELLMEADEQQQELAQLLANLDVDVVLGSHPHVIGPVAWLENEDGSGHRTLVAYSLGNFLSDHEVRSPEVELEGMLCCDFVRTTGAAGTAGTGAGEADTGAANANGIAIENVKWVPLVNHTNEDRTDFAVYALKDYTNDLAKLNAAYENNNVDDPMKWLRDKTREVIGNVIPIDDGTDANANGVVSANNALDALSIGAREAAVIAGMAAVRA